MPAPPPPKLPLLVVSFDTNVADIVVEQQFKPGPTWGVVINTNNNNNNNNNNGINPNYHDQDMLRQRVQEWRATCHTDANAAHNLGIALFRGEGCQKDVAASVKMFSIAAKMGNINSAFNLGWQYTNGSGVRQSWAQAVKWWSFSAHNGHASAARNVGLLYALGIAPDENGEARINHERAVYFYELSCRLGNVKAHLALAQCYRNGHGVTVDENKAIELEAKGAELQREHQLNPPQEEGGLG